MVRNCEIQQFQELAQQWEGGSAKAGNAFIEQIQPLVHFHIRKLDYRRFASRVDQSDLSQIVLERISDVAKRSHLSQRVTNIFYAWLRGFVTNVVTREIRNHCAQKRDWRRQAQFDEAKTRRSYDPRPATELKLMVDEIFESLTAEERRLTQLLANGDSQTEIATELNVHPRTVRRRIAALRVPFSKCVAEPSMN